LFVNNILDSFLNNAFVNEKNEIELTQHDIDNNFIIPTPKRSHRSQLAPILLIKIKSINGITLSRPLLGLCDSGSTKTIIKDTALPFGCKPYISDKQTITTTAQGTYACNELSYLNDMQLPEFVNGRHIQGVTAHVFNSPNCPYDVILLFSSLRIVNAHL
jgi:hypothetical protein